MKNQFKGYERENGFGTRNHILIIPTVACAQITANRIKEASSNLYNTAEGKIKVLNNSYGCCQDGIDLEQTTNTLINTGIHPNVYGVLVLSLGCESVDYEKVANKISAYKPTVSINIQDSNLEKTIEKGVSEIKKMAEAAKKIQRKEADLDYLTVGIQTGGSDYTSGLAANPVVGRVSDKIIESGGTTMVVLSPEWLGAENIYLKNISNERVKNEILETIKKYEKMLKNKPKNDIRGGQPTPGNKQGGITTVEEKALGSAKILGKTPITDVIHYAEIPKNRGHFFMISAGFDPEAVSGMVAAGSNLVLFTTGRGTPTGNVITPVIKITGNIDTYIRMKEIIDFESSNVIKGEETVDKSAEKLIKFLIEIASGKLSKAEINNQDDFGIYRIGPTY